jgi:hypothetical protein
MDIEALWEYFEERAGILEHTAGLPSREAEREAARTTLLYARSRDYSCRALRDALNRFPRLIAEIPDCGDRGYI